MAVAAIQASNLGKLLRTCDAGGACLAIPGTPHYRQALVRGHTLPHRNCIHWISMSKDRWLNEERQRGSRIVAVELAEDATRLADLPPARQRTVVLLGHEHNGVPLDTWHLRVIGAPSPGATGRVKGMLAVSVVGVVARLVLDATEPVLRLSNAVSARPDALDPCAAPGGLR